MAEHGRSAVARWVRRHTPEERLRAALALSEEALATMAARVRARNPDASARDIRASIQRMRDGHG